MTLPSSGQRIPLHLDSVSDIQSAGVVPGSS